MIEPTPLRTLQAAYDDGAQHLAQHKHYVTFGQRYRTEEHPSGLLIHPDAPVILEAPDDMLARMMAAFLFENRWSDVYNRFFWEGDAKEFYPAPPTARISLADPEFRTQIEAAADRLSATATQGEQTL